MRNVASRTACDSIIVAIWSVVRPCIADRLRRELLRAAGGGRRQHRQMDCSPLSFRGMQVPRATSRYLCVSVMGPAASKAFSGRGPAGRKDALLRADAVWNRLCQSVERHLCKRTIAEGREPERHHGLSRV